jgi:hypothetical protein
VLVRTEELEGGQPIVSKPKDPLEVVTTIRESIEASPRKSRKGVPLLGSYDLSFLPV